MKRACVFVFFICVCALGTLVSSARTKIVKRPVANVTDAGNKNDERQQGWSVGDFVSLISQKVGMYYQNQHQCEDVFQSPIDLPLDASIAKYGLLNFTGFQYTYDGSVTLGDKFIEITLTDSSTITVSGAGLPCTFYLDRIRIVSPSLHTLSGVRYPAGLQFIFVNSLYTSYEQAISHDNGVIIIGTFIVVGSEDNPSFETIIEAASGISDESPSRPLESPLVPNSFLPKEKCSFFRYRGKLSKTECKEIVSFTIFTDTIQISQQQLTDIRALFTEEEGEAGKSIPLHGIVDLGYIKPKRRRIVTIQPIMYCKTPFLQKYEFPWYLFHKTH